MVSSLLHRAALLLLSCRAARLSLGPLALHRERCITSIPLHLPAAAARTARTRRAPPRSSATELPAPCTAPHRPPSLATGD
jgi:hypothetical protein